MKNKINVGIIGYNGKKNIGDDLMLLSLHKWLSANFNIENIAIFAEKKFLPLPISNHNKVIGIPLLNKFDMIPFLRGIARKLVFLKFYSNLIKYDIIFVGGGSIIKNLKPLKYLDVLTNSIINLNPKVKLVGIGISIGPFKNNKIEKFAYKVLKKFDKLIVRDLRSYEVLKSKNLQNSYLASDLAYNILNDYGASVKNYDHHITVGISLRSSSMVTEQELMLYEVSQILKIYKDIRVIFFCFCENFVANDYLFTKKLVNKVGIEKSRYSIQNYEQDTNSFLGAFSIPHAHINVRLHSAITAYCFNIRQLIIPYEQKVIDFINETGCEQYDVMSLKAMIKSINSDPDKINTNIRSNTISPFDYL